MGAAHDPMAGRPDPAAPPPLVERLRAVHLRMVDSVLAGEGLGRVAELAAEAAGAPVAIVIPRLGPAALSPGAVADVGLLRRYVADLARGRPASVPPRVGGEVPITSGDETIGRVLLLGEADGDALEFLHLAAVACLTEVAVEEAREEVEQNLRGSFLEELRSRPDMDPVEIVRRAGRLGCDLSRGAVVLCAELTTDRPRHVVATIAGEYPGALAQHMDDRVYAVLPADTPEATQAAARDLAARLQRHGIVGVSSLYGDPAELSRAIQEAELVLDVLRRSDGRAGRAGRFPRTSAAARTACSSACSPRTPRRCAPSTRTPSRRSCATTTSTRPTSSARSRPTSSATAT